MNNVNERSCDNSRQINNMQILNVKKSNDILRSENNSIPSNINYENNPMLNIGHVHNYIGSESKRGNVSVTERNNDNNYIDYKTQQLINKREYQKKYREKTK